MKRLIFLYLIFFISALSAQAYHSLVNDGVTKFKQKNYSDAESAFKKSMSVDSSKFTGAFDLGTTQYKQGKYKDAAASFEKALKNAKTKEQAANGYHNLGNSLLKTNDLEKSIDAYKNALRNKPNDADTKYNLSVALEKMKQNQNKNNNKNNDKNNKDKNKQDQNKNKNNDDKSKKDQDKKNQQNPNQNQNNNQNKQNSPEPKMNKQQAEQFLNAIKDNEKDLQKKLRKRAGVRVKTDKDW